MNDTVVLTKLERAIEHLTGIQQEQTVAVNKLSENVKTLSRVLLGEKETETPGLLVEHRQMQEDIKALMAFKNVCFGLLRAVPKLLGVGVFVYIIVGGSPQDVLELVAGLF